MGIEDCEYGDRATLEIFTEIMTLILRISNMYAGEDTLCQEFAGGCRKIQPAIGDLGIFGF